jgi:hypothetical protein
VSKEFTNPRDVHPYDLGEVGKQMRKWREQKEAQRAAKVRAGFRRLEQREAMGESVSPYESGLWAKIFRS